MPKDARVAWVAARQHRVHHGVYAVWRDGSRAAITTDGVLRQGVPGIETHVGRLRPGDTLSVDGIRVTKVARTLLDLAESSPSTNSSRPSTTPRTTAISARP